MDEMTDAAVAATDRVFAALEAEMVLLDEANDPSVGAMPMRVALLIAGALATASCVVHFDDAKERMLGLVDAAWEEAREEWPATTEH